ncbi:MAG TPA: hypothetical protein VFL41_06500 [Gaiellaceae bacterium]|nr:hypothetical protein [Gaiellaceae bacterium]
MAQRKQAERKQDLLGKLADRGEQVVGRITDFPGAKGLLEQATSMTKRIDELQRRIRSLDPLEKRVAAIERRLDQLEGKKKPARTTRKSTTGRTTGTKRSSTASKSRATTGRTSQRKSGGSGSSSSS